MNILIIHILRFGDALQLTPVIKGMKETYRDATLSVVTSSLGAQIFSKQPEIDRVFPIDVEKLASLVKGSKREDLHSAVDLMERECEPVLNEKWDWVINFNYTFASALLAHLFQGTHPSGFYATPERRYYAKEDWFAYSIAAFAHRKYSSFNWVDINKNVANLPSVPPKTLFPVDAHTMSRIDSRLDEFGFQGHQIVGLAPGTSGDYKQWPIENFIALAGSLVTRHGYKVIVLGDENEQVLGHQIKTAVGSGCEDLTGKTTLSELAGYLSRCDLLVSNDSGPMHLANAVGTPVISLFFSTHFVETGPYGANNIVVFPDIPCFPCKSTANCRHKECLTYIRPETVERIVTDHDRLLTADQRMTLHIADGPVCINRSAFDTWGNLDWIPVDDRPFKREDALRLIFKTFWVSALNGAETDADLDAYVTQTLNHYGSPEHRDGLAAFFDQLTSDFGAMADQYRQSHMLSMQIYHAFLNGEPETVTKLGERLQQIEDDISASGDKDYLSPLIEYINIRLDNTHESDMAHLAIKTARVYQDAEQLSQRLKQNSDRLSAHLLSN